MALAGISSCLWPSERLILISSLSVLRVAESKTYLGSNQRFNHLTSPVEEGPRLVTSCSRTTKPYDYSAPSDPFPRISNQRRIICLSALSVWQQPYWQLTPPCGSEGTVVSLSPRPTPRVSLLYIKNYKSLRRMQRGELMYRRSGVVKKAMQFLMWIQSLLPPCRLSWLQCWAQRLAPRRVLKTVCFTV